MASPDTDPPPARRLTLSIENAKGEELRPESSPSEEADLVVATDSQGNSLTLLEEYARRRESRVAPAELVLSATCAAASLAFAVLIYLNNH